LEEMILIALRKARIHPASPFLIQLELLRARLSRFKIKGANTESISPASSLYVNKICWIWKPNHLSMRLYSKGKSCSWVDAPGLAGIGAPQRQLRQVFAAIAFALQLLSW
jgi:hypothetical protein